MSFIRKYLYPLAGVREDLYFLPEKFYHRFFQVFLILSTVIIFVLVIGFSIEQLRPLPNIGNVHIYENLYSYTEKSDSQIFDTIPRFANLPGFLGGLDHGSGTITDLQAAILNERAICNSNIGENIDSVVTYINNTNPLTNPSIKDSLVKNAQESKTNVVCYIPRDLTDYSPTEIVKYDFTPLTNFLYYTDIVIVCSALTAFWILLLTNLYYRGLIYLLYGRQKMKINKY